MSEFAVEPDALDKMATMVTGYADDADAIRGFIDKEATPGAQEQSLLLWMTDAHQNMVDRMTGRMRMAVDIGNGSASALRAAAEFYRASDEDSAARLDEGYGDFPPPPGLSGTDVGGYEPDFGGVVTPTDRLEFSSSDIEALEPKASGIEDGLRAFADMISPIAWVREVIDIAVPGADPIGWVLQWFAGDWQAWARCALTWEACEAAAGGMASNVEDLVMDSEQIWEGNAAEEARDYFRRLSSATGTEAVAFDGLYEREKQMLELCYSFYTTINDTLNTIIDTILNAAGTALCAMLTGVSMEELAGSIGTLVSMVGDVMMVIIEVIDLVDNFVAAFSRDDLPDVPASELPDLGSPDDSPRYHHPEED